MKYISKLIRIPLTFLACSIVGITSVMLLVMIVLLYIEGSDGMIPTLSAMVVAMLSCLYLTFEEKLWGSDNPLNPVSKSF